MGNHIKVDSYSLLKRFNYKEIIVILFPLIVSVAFICIQGIMESMIIWLGMIILVVIQLVLILKRKMFLISFLKISDNVVQLKLYKWMTVYFDGEISRSDFKIQVLIDTSSRFKQRKAKICFMNHQVIIYENSLFRSKEFDEIEKMIGIAYID